MADDRVVYGTVTSTGPLSAEIEGQVYTGISSQDPDLQVGDQVPAGFLLPGSSRQPMLISQPASIFEVPLSVLAPQQQIPVWGVENHDTSRTQQTSKFFANQAYGEWDLPWIAKLARSYGNSLVIVADDSAQHGPNGGDDPRVFSRVALFDGAGNITTGNLTLLASTLIVVGNLIYATGMVYTTYVNSVSAQDYFPNYCVACYDLTFAQQWIYPAPYTPANGYAYPSQNHATVAVLIEPICVSGVLYVFQTATNFVSPPLTQQMLSLGANSGALLNSIPWAFPGGPFRGSGAVNSVLGDNELGTLTGAGATAGKTLHFRFEALQQHRRGLLPTSSSDGMALS